jgi:hypothetical protein
MSAMPPSPYRAPDAPTPRPRRGRESGVLLLALIALLLVVAYAARGGP